MKARYFRQRQRWQEVEELKDEANPFTPDSGQRILLEPVETDAFQADRTRARTIHAAAQMQERGLAATRRPHESDETAALDRQGPTPRSAATVRLARP